MTDRVRTKPLAVAAIEAVDRGHVSSWSELSEIVLGRRDTSQLKRTLGLQTRSDGSVRTSMEYDEAVRLVKALPNVDPIDVGV